MRKALTAIAVLLALAAPSRADNIFGYAPNLPTTARVLSAKGLDFHTATGDVGTLAVPSSISKFVVTAVQITNCSATPVLAQVAVYSAVAAGGTNIVAAATITSASAPTVVVNETVTAAGLTTALTTTSLTVRLAVANAAALTCDVYATINDLT